MALRPVPWAIGNGAENSVELARAGIYSATSGATGITEPTDFVVKALPTPGAAVRVHRGGGVIKSTYPGVFGQSYAVQEQSYTDVPVAATGSSGGATKYVYVLIKDTQYGGQTPPSVEEGPYNEYAVTTTLPTNQPYLLLAKIVQPASTATITGAMITDMREMANPRIKVVNRARPSVATDTAMVLNSTTGEYFPGDGGASGGTQEIAVPAWATRMIVEAMWIGVEYSAGTNSYGKYWIEYGINADRYITQDFAFNSPGTAADGMRANWPLADDRHVPVAMRGNVGVFSFGAKRDAPSTGRAHMDRLSGLSLKVTFLEVPDQSTS